MNSVYYFLLINKKKGNYRFFVNKMELKDFICKLLVVI